MNEKYTPCTWCEKLNHQDRTECAWCYRPIPTRRQRLFQALVFWSSIAGILAAAYVAYQIGGVS